MHPAAKPTCIPPQFTFGTEGRELTVRPLFRRDAVFCETVVATPSRIESAVHTWAAQHLYRAHGQHLELPRRRMPADKAVIILL